MGSAGGLCAPARGNAACAARRLARPSVAHDADDGYACGSGCRGQGATRRARPSTLRGHVAEDGYLFVSTPEGQRVVLALRLGSTYDGARCGVGWACCLRRCGCSAIARSTSRIWLSLECYSSLPRTLPSGADSATSCASACLHAPRRAGRGSSGRAVFADRGGG